MTSVENTNNFGDETHFFGEQSPSEFVNSMNFKKKKKKNKKIIYIILIIIFIAIPIIYLISYNTIFSVKYYVNKNNMDKIFLILSIIIPIIGVSSVIFKYYY
jgi:high-affinity K+ transport system ATPase subunit B